MDSSSLIKKKHRESDDKRKWRTAVWSWNSLKKEEHSNVEMCGAKWIVKIKGSLCLGPDELFKKKKFGSKMG